MPAREITSAVAALRASTKTTPAPRSSTAGYTTNPAICYVRRRDARAHRPKSHWRCKGASAAAAMRSTQLQSVGRRRPRARVQEPASRQAQRPYDRQRSRRYSQCAYRPANPRRSRRQPARHRLAPRRPQRQLAAHSLSDARRPTRWPNAAAIELASAPALDCAPTAAPAGISNTCLDTTRPDRAASTAGLTLRCASRTDSRSRRRSRPSCPARTGRHTGPPHAPAVTSISPSNTPRTRRGHRRAEAHSPPG